MCFRIQVVDITLATFLNTHLHLLSFLPFLNTSSLSSPPSHSLTPGSIGRASHNIRAAITTLGCY
ncbi:hypothetical protein E2C01_019728 [Portunus trituberculatus]|uniref:Uncharacterized protein n=1 Tax=Portunus trituberculatus TaxID=210409 RepID=A0A5B7E063_PORTR|nr:hypothetical protein [Portunus trituberculatus]